MDFIFKPLSAGELEEDADCSMKEWEDEKTMLVCAFVACLIEKLDN